MGRETLEIADTRDLILAYIKKDSRNLTWLSKQIGVNYSTMYSIFTQKTIKLSEFNLQKINKFLKTDFKL